jgi:hypothetical protein
MLLWNVCWLSGHFLPVGRVETGAVMVGAAARVGETSEVDHRVRWQAMTELACAVCDKRSRRRAGSPTAPRQRSRATQFFLQIEPIQTTRMRREASRVLFLMCPFCVRFVSAH